MILNVNLDKNSNTEDNNNNKVNEEKSKEFFTLEDFTTFMTINHFECFVSNIIRR